MSILLKDPASRLDYQIDWRTDGYLNSSDSLSASAWTVSPNSTSGGLQVVASTYDSTAGTTTVTVSTGTHPIRYKLTNRITINSTDIDERTFYIQVWEPR